MGDININVSSQASAFFKNVDTDKNGKVEAKELQKLADKDGNGFVSEEEGKELETKLGSFIKDKDLVSDLVKTAKNANFSSTSFTFNPVKSENPINKVPEIKGELKTVPDVKFGNGPADPPQIVKNPGKPADISLGKGVTIKDWPPTRVTFTDPDTKKKVEGYKIELSSGDVILLPKGQAAFIKQKSDVGGQAYYIKESGDINASVGRYSSVIATRNIMI